MSVLRVAFAGTPDFAVPALRALLGSSHEVVGVLTRPDKPKGRGQELAASPVKLVAQQRGLPVSQPQTLKTAADRATLAAWNPDLLVVVAYGVILPPEVLSWPRLGCVNIHASLLPRWRGAAPIQRAILSGDTQTGVTIMRMDAGLDTGPILLKRQVAIELSDTSGSLHDRLADLGAAALLRTLAAIAEDKSISTPQPEDGVTYAAKISKSEAIIDWRRPAREIERQIRAFNPWPIAQTMLQGECLKVWGAKLDAEVAASDNTGQAHESGQSGTSREASPARGDAEPGSVITVRDDGVVVACAEGRLVLTEVQRPGRRPVKARDFANAVRLAGVCFG